MHLVEVNCWHKLGSADGRNFSNHCFQQRRHHWRYQKSSRSRAKTLQQAERISHPYDHSVDQREVKLCLSFPASLDLHYHCKQFCWWEESSRETKLPLHAEQSGQKREDAPLSVSSAAVPLLTAPAGKRIRLF